MTSKKEIANEKIAQIIQDLSHAKKAAEKQIELICEEAGITAYMGEYDVDGRTYFPQKVIDKFNAKFPKLADSEDYERNDEDQGVYGVPSKPRWVYSSENG